MKFCFLSFLLVVTFVWAAYSQEIDAARLAAQVAQIFRENEDEYRREAMQEFDKMDTNFDGYLQQNEFASASGYGTTEQRNLAFQKMDGNHDGALSKEEMWSFVKSNIQFFQ